MLPSGRGKRTRTRVSQRETHRTQHRQQPRQQLRLQQWHGGRRRGGGDVGERAEDARRRERAGLAVLEQRVRHRRRLDVGALGEDEEELRRRLDRLGVLRGEELRHAALEERRGERVAEADRLPRDRRRRAEHARALRRRRPRRRAEQLDRRREDGVGRGGGELDERGLDRAAHVGRGVGGGGEEGGDGGHEEFFVRVRGSVAQNQEIRAALYGNRDLPVKSREYK